MKIQCLFVIRDRHHGLPGCPELLEAWDEYSIDENVEGWHEACTKALAALEGEYLKHAYVDIEVDIDDITDKIMGSTISGKVV